MSQRVTGTGFPQVLARLGVRGPVLPFDLDSVVRPVSVVDLDVPLVVSTPVSDLAFTAGEIFTPADLTVMADTGPQPAGNYFALFMVASGEPVGGATAYRLQRRDAPNAANIWTQIIIADRHTTQFAYRIRLELNERLRVIKNGLGGAFTHQASIWLTLT